MSVMLKFLERMFRKAFSVICSFKSRFLGMNCKHNLKLVENDLHILILFKFFFYKYKSISSNVIKTKAL